MRNAIFDCNAITVIVIKLSKKFQDFMEKNMLLLNIPSFTI